MDLEQDVKTEELNAPDEIPSNTKRKQEVLGDADELNTSPLKFLKENADGKPMTDQAMELDDEPKTLQDIDAETNATSDSPTISSTAAEYEQTPLHLPVSDIPIIQEKDGKCTSPTSAGDNQPYQDRNNNNSNSCDSDVSAPTYDASEQKAAEDIVRKLCKNGKLMEFQEGEDFIKVIVYEDSQEDDDVVQSTDEEEQPANSYTAPTKTLGGRGQSRNLLDCLTDSGKENQTSKPVVESKRQSEHTPSGLFQCENREMSHGQETFPRSLPENKQMSSSMSSQPLYNSAHSRNGAYSFYSESAGVSSQTCATQANLQHRTPGQTPTSSRMKSGVCKNVQLNSSGEEISPSCDPLGVPSSEQLHNRVRSLMHLPQFQVEDNGKIREQHNQKERRRRARIKEACNLLRQLVPGMSDKTDKATVFEFAARYVHFLKSHTGAQYDKDFLMKYSPY